MVSLTLFLYPYVGIFMSINFTFLESWYVEYEVTFPFESSNAHTKELSPSSTSRIDMGER